MHTSVRRRAALQGCAALFASAAGEADPNPDAAVEIEEVRIGLLIVGGSIGGGRLRYHGRELDFSITGLSTGSVGISTLSARGEVFGLGRLEDFAGSYTEFQGTGFAGAAAGSQVRWLQNARGVQLRLRSMRSGVMLDISASGVFIEMR